MERGGSLLCCLLQYNPARGMAGRILHVRRGMAGVLFPWAPTRRRDGACGPTLSQEEARNKAGRWYLFPEIKKDLPEPCFRHAPVVQVAEAVFFYLYAAICDSPLC